MSVELMLVYNENASVPFAVVDADWASRDLATGRTEFYKNRQLVNVLTLEPSQYVLVAPLNAPSLH
jgi:hypothetical protein